MASKLLLRQFYKVYRNSRWFRSHFTFMGHTLLIFLFVSAAFGVDTQATTSYQAFTFLLMLLILAFLNSFLIKLNISAKRHLPKYFTVGEQSHYRIKIRNKSKKYQNITIYEELQTYKITSSQINHWFGLYLLPWHKRVISFNLWRKFMAYKRGAEINKVQLLLLEEKKDESEVQVEFTPIRRGILEFKGFYIAIPDILGLYQKNIFIPLKQSCLILPRRFPVAPLKLEGNRKHQSGGVSLASSVGDSSEFLSLRDYRKGDPLNSVNWKSFARHGKLIVKEYQDEYFVRRALLLDTFLDESSNVLFESAVSVAASICMTQRQNDALLDLMFVGDKAHCFTSGRGIDHMPHIQEVLACVQPSSDSFETLQDAIMQHLPICSSLVCVLMSWDKKRQELVNKFQINNIPYAVFLIHDGSLKISEIENKPENFYLIDHNNLADDLGAV